MVLLILFTCVYVLIGFVCIFNLEYGLHAPALKMPTFFVMKYTTLVFNVVKVMKL